MPIAADYPFLDIVGTMLVLFAWVIWFWLLIVVFGDLFRRNDVSGWGKAGWTVLLILLPYLGVLIYMVAQGRQMAERKAADAAAGEAAFGEYVRSVAADGGASGEIARAKQLLDEGIIDGVEYEQLKRKALSQ